MNPNYVMIPLMIVVFYFFMIRPQQKKQKEVASFLEGLKKGDDVVTVGGMHGKISEITNDAVVLEFDKGLKIKFDKASVSMESTKKSGSSKA
jgi:preprotein translocase subunit YajC